MAELLGSIKVLDEDRFSICKEDLEWLLHCTKNILDSDIKSFNGSPMQKMVQHNIDCVVDAIALVEELG